MNVLQGTHTAFPRFLATHIANFGKILPLAKDPIRLVVAILVIMATLIVKVKITTLHIANTGNIQDHASAVISPVNVKNALVVMKDAEQLTEMLPTVNGGSRNPFALGAIKPVVASKFLHEPFVHTTNIRNLCIYISAVLMISSFDEHLFNS